MRARAKGSLLLASSHWWSSGEDFWFFTQVTQFQFLGRELRSLKTTPCYLSKIKLVKRSQEMKDFWVDSNILWPLLYNFHLAAVSSAFSVEKDLVFLCLHMFMCLTTPLFSQLSPILTSVFLSAPLILFFILWHSLFLLFWNSTLSWYATALEIGKKKFLGLFPGVSALVCLGIIQLTVLTWLQWLDLTGLTPIRNCF